MTARMAADGRRRLGGRDRTRPAAARRRPAPSRSRGARRAGGRRPGAVPRPPAAGELAADLRRPRPRSARASRPNCGWPSRCRRAAELLTATVAPAAHLALVDRRDGRRRCRRAGSTTLGFAMQPTRWGRTRTGRATVTAYAAQGMWQCRGVATDAAVKVVFGRERFTASDTVPLATGVVGVAPLAPARRGRRSRRRPPVRARRPAQADQLARLAAHRRVARDGHRHRPRRDGDARRRQLGRRGRRGGRGRRQPRPRGARRGVDRRALPACRRPGRPASTPVVAADRAARHRPSRTSSASSTCSSTSTPTRPGGRSACPCSASSPGSRRGRWSS